MIRHQPTAAADRTAVRLLFGVHLHQPVGNFDHVFAEHARAVYRPLIDQLARRRLGPALLHISGPLLEWLEAHDVPLLDRIGRLAADGGLEFLLAGMYEPILPAIPRADRVEQIGWLREALRSRFGVAGDGMWLTERVWEQELVADIASADVRYVLVDDRHFLVSGFRRDELHVPYRTESDSHVVTVLAIDERLRYLIPFRPPSEMADYLRALHDERLPLAVFADDGEKFGGWPGTLEWVYTHGWFDRFCDVIDELRDEGIVRLSGGAEALDAVPAGGLTYLPTASYREMEGWALPAEASNRLAALESDLGAERMAGPDGALVRGSHWRHFLVRYPEANRLHKKACALSALCRRSGDPPAARRAIGRAQCNDALWHGVFGGLYLPHLRSALWRNLAFAEGTLRSGQPLSANVVDLDADGADEAWVHSSAYSAQVASARGGALVELTDFAAGVNYADVLTRRLEAYHRPHPGRTVAGGSHDGTASIHEMEAALAVETLPPVDLDDRAIGVVRAIRRDVTAGAWAAADYVPLATWARERCAMSVDARENEIVVRCDARGYGVEWRFTPSGPAAAHWWWDADGLDAGARVAIELSWSRPLEVGAPAALDRWCYAIDTLAKSERGLERVTQGEAVTLLFVAGAGCADLTFGPAR